MSISTSAHRIAVLVAFISAMAAGAHVCQAGDIAVRGKTIYTMDGPPIQDGIVVIRDGKIQQIGSADSIGVPEGVSVVEANVVTPGLVDARSVVGLAGILNQDGDQDQLESSDSIQPQLRAIDAYNAHDPLIEWIRGFGVTTVHTGHGPGKLISGQTMVVKTSGNTVSESVLNPAWGVVATLGPGGQEGGSKSPGTRGKAIAMLRQKFIDAIAYKDKRAGDDGDATARNLELESLVAVLDGEMKLVVEADRAIDIRNAIRFAEEFELKIVLCSAAEAYTLIDLIKETEFPVIVHPSMSRSSGERENLTFRNAAMLSDAGIHVALQSGFEAYVPKCRVVLFEAGVAASHGLGFERALASITIDAAELLGIDSRVGSIEVGKDGDLALFDGDPFEYTTHCTTTIIDGEVVSKGERQSGD
jgi:imidazolonepropionase-like amidohydrolase